MNQIAIDWIATIGAMWLMQSAIIVGLAPLGVAFWLIAHRVLKGKK